MFKERVSSKVSCLRESAIELGKAVASQDLERFEQEVFEVYTQLGTGDFDVILFFTENGDLRMRFLYEGKDYARKDNNMRGGYTELSMLAKRFFQEGYASVWQAEGFKDSPLCWYQVKFSDLIS